MSNSDAEYRAFSEQFLHKGKIKELLKKEKRGVYNAIMKVQLYGGLTVLRFPHFALCSK